MAATHGVSQSALINTVGDWLYNDDNPLPFLGVEELGWSDFELMSCGSYTESLLGPSYRNSLPILPLEPPSQTKQAISCQSTQSWTTDVEREKTLKQRKSVPGEDNDLVQKAEKKCDYAACHKSFSRDEHLRRHKQTFHGEGHHRFSCDFCGKDQFNRHDNLHSHRKLHARYNSRSRGVEFIAAAVPVIEQEMRSRKRRAPFKVKTLPIRTPAAEKKRDRSF